MLKYRFVDHTVAINKNQLESDSDPFSIVFFILKLFQILFEIFRNIQNIHYRIHCGDNDCSVEIIGRRAVGTWIVSFGSLRG